MDDRHQGHVAGPAQPGCDLPGVDRARQITAGLRAAMDGVVRSVATLAARVRDAHAARIWLPLGHSGWASYCGAEFGISRAQAYRLLDVAHAQAAIHGAVTASTDPSRTRDTDPVAEAALDYGLSQRALVDVCARRGDVAQLITRRLATLTHNGENPLDEPAVREVVRQAVHDIRATPSPPPVCPSADPALAALRAVVDDLAAGTHQVGELMLEVAPAHLSDAAAAHVLAPLCEEIGEGLDHALAARRYAISGDRRALNGTVL
ncbi:hypothetical protein [Streptomyces longhuiensis]|uniref:hypothetical protein n=1 Tax=Streptomyces longhuiensis TaxID=2880933 RepID=UPI001D0B90EB|nr:hypothetical protein [Streptomyces longhuiensis]UDM05471.1 hypothetical protein LGI35_45270 [Streptomyces longhuiensis]